MKAYYVGVMESCSLVTDFISTCSNHIEDLGQSCDW